MEFLRTAMLRVLLSRALPPLAAGLLALACTREAAGGPEAPGTPADGAEGGLVLLPPAAGPSAADPDLPARPYFHDFGRVRAGAPVEHTFRLRNVEDVPITVTRVVPSCGCTVPRLSCRLPSGEVLKGKPVLPGARDLLVVPPGAELDLLVHVDTHNVKLRNVDQLLSVSLQTDHAESYFRQFETHILVESPFELVPRDIQLGSFAGSAGARGRLEIVPAGGFRQRIVGVQAPAGVEATLGQEQRFGQEIWVLEAGFVPPVEHGLALARLQLAIEDEAGAPQAPLEVVVAGQSVADVQSDPSRLVIVASRSGGGPFEAQVRLRSLLPGQLLRVTGAEVEEPHRAYLALVVEPESPDDDGRAAQWLLRLAAREPLPAEMLSGTASVRLDDPQTPEVRVPYVLHLR
jgi:hypothetical protein